MIPTLWELEEGEGLIYDIVSFKRIYSKNFFLLAWRGCCLSYLHSFSSCLELLSFVIRGCCTYVIDWWSIQVLSLQFLWKQFGSDYIQFNLFCNFVSFPIYCCMPLFINIFFCALFFVCLAHKITARSTSFMTIKQVMPTL